MKNEKGEPEDEEEDEEEVEEEKSEQVEDATLGISSGNESEDVDKSTRPSHSPSSSCETSTLRTSGRLRGQILQDIQKQKRRKAKLEEAKQERIRLARSHLEKGIEGTNFKIPDNFECPFDTTKTGLGGARLTEDYRAALARKKLKKESTTDSMQRSSQWSRLTTVEKPGNVHESIDRSDDIDETSESNYTYTSQTINRQSDGEDNQRCADTGSFQQSSIGSASRDTKVRFMAPGHIEKRLRPSSKEVIPWFKERLQVSSLSVRFEIPMDVRDFREMEVMTYLLKYCKIPPERMVIYKQLYKQHKAPKTHLMTTVELSRAIHEVLYDSVSEETITWFLRFLQLDNITAGMDLKTFSVVAATAERILYLTFAETAGPVSPGVLRSFIESADFNSLKWKLDKIVMDKRLKRLLYSLG